MKKILVAIDGSSAAVRAARVAIELSKLSQGEVTLAHIVPPVFVPPEVPFGATPFNDEAIKAGERVLDEAVKELGAAGLKRVNLTGSPAERLSDYAEQEGFDLVVVGSKGRGAVSRVLIGSVTDRVVHICKKPVLVVR